MDNRKSILIFGPISDFGGREIMTNLLYKSLHKHFNTQILSTTLISKESDALKNVEKKHWTSVGKEIYNGNLFIKATSVLAKTIYKHKEPSYFFIKNKLTKTNYDFNIAYKKVIEAYVKKADLVIYSDEISGKWLDFIKLSCIKNHTKLLLRITGKIVEIPKTLQTINSNINVLVHSAENLEKLKSFKNLKVLKIDQTTSQEEQLLNLPIETNEKLIYGFIGRFSHEKGFMELINAFVNNKKSLVIAGNGPLLNKFEKIKANNIQYLGQFNPKDISKFYSKVDVIIIPSFEEGGPIVGVEAMAAGKLIISTKVGAMEERFAKTSNNFWFSHDEENALNKVIEKVDLLSKANQLKIREELRTVYKNNNSMEVIKLKYIKLFNAILNS